MGIRIQSKSAATDVVTNSLSLNHTVEGGEGLALIAIMALRGTESVTLCAWDQANGTPLQELAVIEGTTTSDRTIHIHGLLNPDVKTANLVWNISASSVGVGALLVLEGVAGFGATASDNSTSANSSSLNLSTNNPNDWIIDLLAVLNATDATEDHVPGPTQELLYRVQNGTFSDIKFAASVATRFVGDGDYYSRDMKWDWTTAEDMAHAAVVIKSSEPVGKEPVIAFRKPWTTQPPAGTPVDWSNPLTTNLVLAVNGNQYNTATLTDSANKNHWVLKESTAGSTSPQFVSEGSNIALSNRPDPSYYWEHPTADPGGLFTVSIICIFRVNNHMPNGCMPFGCGETAIAADHRICFKIYSDEIRIQTYQDGNATAYNYEIFGGPGVLTNQWYAVGGLFDTSDGKQDLYYYIDDKFDIEGPQLPTIGFPIFSTDPQKYKIANADVGDANREFDGDVLFAAAWHDRRLSHTEFFSVMNNPWQLFKPQTIYLGKPEARRVVVF